MKNLAAAPGSSITIGGTRTHSGIGRDTRSVIEGEDVMTTSLNQSPLLSITVLNYNYGHFLPMCLDSILSQNFKDYEIILINDKSTDNSLEVIKPYLTDPRIRLIDHEVNKGFVASLIEGAELSRGRYITVISADDWILETSAISKQVKILEQDSEIVFVYTAYGHFENPNKCDYVWRAANESNILNKREAFRELVLYPFILHSGTIIRKTAYDTIGGYEAKYRYSVDTRMWLGLCHTGKVAYINEALYGYRRHESNMSKNVRSYQRAIFELLSAIEWSFGLIPSPERESLSKLKSEAEQKILVAFVIDDIFRDHYRAGWTYFWTAFKMRPTQTLFQKTTIVIALRTLLGRGGYMFLEHIKGKFSTKSRERLATETSHIQLN